MTEPFIDREIQKIFNIPSKFAFQQDKILIYIIRNHYRVECLKNFGYCRIYIELRENDQSCRERYGKFLCRNDKRCFVSFHENNFGDCYYGNIDYGNIILVT